MLILSLNIIYQVCRRFFEIQCPNVLVVLCIYVEFGCNLNVLLG